MIFPFGSVVFSCTLRASLSVVLSSSLLHAEVHTDFCDDVSMTATAVLLKTEFMFHKKHTMVAELDL